MVNEQRGRVALRAKLDLDGLIWLEALQGETPLGVGCRFIAGKPRPGVDNYAGQRLTLLVDDAAGELASASFVDLWVDEGRVIASRRGREMWR